MMEIEAMEIHTIETQALETSAMVMEPQTVSVPAYVEIPAPIYQEKPVYEFFKRCFDIAAAVGLLLVGQMHRQEMMKLPPILWQQHQRQWI